MATVLDSIAVPRRSSSLLPKPHLSIAPSASLIPSSKQRPLPHVHGLKLRFASSSPTRSLGSVSRTFPSRPRLVCEAQEIAVEAPAVVEETWQSLVLESDSPVLVEFWAPWCGPCRMIHPIIDELAKQYAGKLKCYKVNTDESPSIATRYGIRSIPTVMIFKNGEKKDSVIGAVPKTTLTTSIEKFL